LLAVLLVNAGAAAGAQTALVGTVLGNGANGTNGSNSPSETNGSLAGKLTDLHSTPLSGATVIVRNDATGVEAQGVTKKNGSFRFTRLEPGSYTVEAASDSLGRGRLLGIVVSAGREAQVQASMAFEAVAGQPVNAALAAPTADAMKAPPVPADPPRELALLEYRAAESALESPQTETEVVTEPLAAEPIQKLNLSGRDLWRESRPMPATASQVLTSELGSEVLQTLDLSGHLESGPASSDTRAVPTAEKLTSTGILEGFPTGQDFSRAANPAISMWASAAAGRFLSVSPEPSSSSANSIVQIAALAPGGTLVVSEAAASAVLAALEFEPLPARPLHAASERIDSVTAVVVSTLTGAEIQALPAVGRRWQDFVLDSPTAGTAAGGSSATSLRGAGQQPAETALDGSSTRIAFGGQGSSGPGSNGQGGSEQNGMGQAWAGGHGLQVAQSAVREVQMAAGNAEAEGMRTAGGRVNVETTRGTNGLHGQGFASDRQNTWGAQNPFTQWVKQTAPATLIAPPVFTGEPYTPPDHESVWGFGIGNQLRRDKLFWFGALDSYRRNDPGLATVKHPDKFFAQPSNDQMQVLSARLELPSKNPVAEGLNAYSQLLTSLAGLLGPAPRTAAQWVGFGRLDWDASERNRFTLEATGALWNSPGGGLTRVSEPYGSNSFGSSKASEELLLGRWEAFLTPNLLAVSQGSAGRTIQSAHAETPSAYEQLFLAPNPWGQLPQIVVDNRYGFTIGNPSRFSTGSYPDEHVYQGQETVDWVHGTLLVKGGFELSHNADATSLLRNQTGTYTYSNVENFASDALVFAQYGLQNPNDADIQHNCDQTGTVWRDSSGGLRGLGNLPCYSYYSQMIGPTNWYLSTNDWAGFTTFQWQPGKLMVVSGGLRWEREQLPPPIAALANTDPLTYLPLTQKLPSLGNDWGPRIGMALGNAETHWPVLRLGYGVYFGRTENATIETALTQAGSPNGDLNFFMRPTDDLLAGGGGAPPFPYVFKGPPGSMVKPGAVEFAPTFRNPEVHQAVAAVEESLPGHVKVTASALLSLGRRLPISIDTNIDTAPADAGKITYDVVNCPETFPNVVVTCTGAGPIKATQITVPFYASSSQSTGSSGRPDPSYQQISEIMSRANSTYEAAMLKVVRYGRHGLSLHAHYTYAHAMDWNPNESTTVAGSDVLDPADFGQEYGTGNLDVRHSAAVMAVVEAPWKLHGLAGQFANGWMVSGIGQFHSGLPYTMRVSGSLPKCVVSAGVTPCTSQDTGLKEAIGDAIVGLGPSMNGSGGDNRVYGVGNDNVAYNIGRNTYRYPATWKADMRVGKKIDLGRMRQLELLVESFNLFNHQNVTELETTGYYLESGTASSPPKLNFLNTFTTKPPLSGDVTSASFGKPLNVNATSFYRERQIQVGVRVRF